MTFLIDAQLPARLARFLRDAGHDAVHTSALPTDNHTTDTQITELADREPSGRYPQGPGLPGRSSAVGLAADS